MAKTPASPLRALRPWGTFLLFALAALYLAPLLWMFVTSLKTDAEAVSRVPSLWPRAPTLAAYEAILKAPNVPVLRWFLNSLLAALAHAALVVVVSALAAYALARLSFAGRKVLFLLVMGTLFVPPVTLLAPNFLVVASLGWLDSLLAVIVPGAASGFGVFFLRQFFLSLPRELEEAALLDGASRFQLFWQVIVPLSRPALVTLALLSFLANWNDFLWPLYVLLNPSMLTLPAGLSQLQGAYTTHYPAIMAGAVIASVPVLLLFVLAQRHIIEGVSRSGLKG
jgi:multiple sugar transport system permease protein